MFKIASKIFIGKDPFFTIKLIFGYVFFVDVKASCSA